MEYAQFTLHFLEILLAVVVFLALSLVWTYIKEEARDILSGASASRKKADKEYEAIWGTKAYRARHATIDNFFGELVEENRHYELHHKPLWR